MGEKTCVIDHHPVTYAWARCATVCFDLAESLDAIMGTMSVLKGAHLCWSYLSSAVCAKCGKFGHSSLGCIQHLTPIARPVSFGSVLWAKIVGGFSFYPFLVQNVSLNDSSSLEMKSTLPVVSDLEKRFAVLESSIVNLIKQIDKLNKRLDSFVLVVSQSNPGCQLLVGDVVMEEGLDEATCGNIAVILVSSALSKVKRLESMLEELSASVLSLMARFDGSILASDALPKSLSQ
ncbi:hypothetical protein G9A89_001286 [Geosiphon pyriformis]|nr:hypothetical protein G9A89_001286 [Geosiphon pyriformis]